MASNKIEHIVTIGTSFTHGGGYAEGGETRKILEKYEQDIPALQEDCAWPAYFQKMINPKIKVHNLALSGSGVEYMIRTVNEWIVQNPSKVNNTLFLLEVSGYGRMEFWDNEVQNHVVCNWSYDDKTGEFNPSLHNGIYWRETYEYNKLIASGEPLIKDFLKRYCEPMKSVEKLQSEFFDFLCKLQYKEINFKLFGEHFYDGEIHNDPLVENNRLFLTDKFGNTHCGIHQFIQSEEAQILHVTKGESNDFHACLYGNRLIAKQYYHQLREVYNL